MKAGPLIIFGFIISIYPVFILFALCTSGGGMSSDVAVAFSAFSIIGAMFICTGLVLNELTKRNK